LPPDETKRPVVTPRRTVARPRSAPAAHRRALGASAVLMLALHRTRAAHGRSGAGRMTNERAAQHSVAVARQAKQSSSSGVVVGHTHMHSVCQQRSSASLGLALSQPTSVQRARHVVLSCDEPPACRASQRTRALGLSAEIGSARVAGAWWARGSAAEHRGR
jgi:hypothetical protein